MQQSRIGNLAGFAKETGLVNNEEDLLEACCFPGKIFPAFVLIEYRKSVFLK